MVINKVKLFNGNTVNINIGDGKITSVTGNKSDTTDPFLLQFDNALAFPGLINSHDHLDFNLFPMLGNRIYKNYTEWGNDIHKKYKAEIDKVLKVPETLRVTWGIYKNLLCGVTTVVNHGKNLEIDDPLINVVQPKQNLHSTAFEKFWKLKLNNPLKKNEPCVIHAGEGTDKRSADEIDKLIKWNLLKRNLIAIHGVAMNEKQASNFKALVWCPQSNNFLLEKTAEVNKIKSYTQVCFGTDSTLTGDWNIWDHLRHARNLKLVNDTELLEMLTVNPAAIWGLQSGIIDEKMDADIVIAEAENNSLDSFYSLNPDNILMVMQQGNIQLFDEKLYTQLNNAPFSLADFYKIEINGSYKYIRGNLPGLIKEIRKYNHSADFPIAWNLKLSMVNNK